MPTVRLLALALAAATTVVSSASAAPPRPGKVLTKEERIERNNYLARKVYDGYKNLPKVGYVEAWEVEDSAPNRVTGSYMKSDRPEDFTGPNSNFERRWTELVVEKPRSWRVGNKIEYEGILKVLPDFKLVIPYKAFCSEEGCAMQLAAGGHTNKGKYVEVHESIFFWTNEIGQITRIEAFDDYVHMPRFHSVMSGVPEAEVDTNDYIEAMERRAREPVPAKAK